MRFTKFSIVLALALFSHLLVVPPAMAAIDGRDLQLNEIINEVSGPFNAATDGEADFGSIAAIVAEHAQVLINIVAIITVIIAGTVMTLSESEQQAAQARRTVIGSIVAILLVNIAGPIRNAVINNRGAGIIQGPDTAGTDLEKEIAGVIQWIQVPLAVIAVIMIIISGIRAIANFGSDEGLTQLRRTVFSVIFGITLIAVKAMLTGSIVEDGTPDGLIGTILGVVNIALTFIGLAAFTVIVIAAFFMILNVGNDEQYRRAQSLIIRVAIGLLIVIAAAAIVNLIFAGAANQIV